MVDLVDLGDVNKVIYVGFSLDPLSTLLNTPNMRKLDQLGMFT
jgi:hypothetical protein